MEWYKILLAISYAVGAIVGGMAIYFTRIIYKIKVQHLELEREMAKSKLESLKAESSNKINAFKQAAAITADISESISKKLIENPSWLDRFMDQTGVTYSASVYGKRIGHFYYEKGVIAKQAIDKIQSDILRNTSSGQYCLLIDSGTTMYPVFQEISSRLHDKDSRIRKYWREKVCIVTNNLPGIQYLMKNAKADLDDDYSDIALNCFLIPGKPLSVYAAITGVESEKWLKQLKQFLDSPDTWRGNNWRKAERDMHILGFVTGNYIAAHNANGEKTRYYPVARGEGHVEIKKVIVDISEQIYLLSPLMKFTFADVNLLNRVNNFDINRVDYDKARKQPNKVMYEEIPIDDSKPCYFFTTRRPKGSLFNGFGENLNAALHDRYSEHNVVMPEFNIRYWNLSEDNVNLELEREIPHDNLRKQYQDGNNIWDELWVIKNR